MDTFTNAYFIVAGNTNAHSPTWGGECLDSRGRLLENFYARNSLLILNNPNSPPTFTSSRGHSWIDVTACSTECFPLISDWKILDDSVDDHAFISFTIGVNSPGLSHRRLKYSLKHANWSALQLFLEDNLVPCDHDDPNVVRVQIDHNIEVINTACSSHIPMYTNKRKPVPWWTSELTGLRKENIRLRKKYQNCHTEPNRTNHKQLYFDHLHLVQKQNKACKTGVLEKFLCLYH
ncbi:uncharacterized protein LOC111640415 [Centruroides sculpturatus]|uniref:uncharacterized protein LOC111640415 n=1 Tax=Centruroides sculpturatus TaxID=218467 RepID=UPI000C6DFBFE|nr:uncharacterized protein LOC111640415 [Centruroides sculpturatus]